MNATTLQVTFEHDQDMYRCELHDLDIQGLECHWFLNGTLLQTRRFTIARLALQWAEEKRRAILAGTAEWS